jgi:hypothetical protein
MTVIGWKLFIHSVNMVLHNIPQLLRIFLLPTILTAAIVYLMVRYLFNGTLDVASGIAPLMWRIAAIGGVAMALTCWGTVSWHRYVLLEEYPKGWIPAIHMRRIGAYLLGLLKLMLVGIAVFGVLGLVSVPLISGMEVFGVALVLGLALVVLVFMYRLILILPAAALGQRLGLSQSLQKTEGAFGTLFILSSCLIGLQLIAELILYLMGDLVALAAVFQIVFGLFQGVLSISVLTTLYGYYVEKRQI